MRWRAPIATAAQQIAWLGSVSISRAWFEMEYEYGTASLFYRFLALQARP